MDSEKRKTIDYILYPLIIVPIFFVPSIEDVFNLPKLWLLISFTTGTCVHFCMNKNETMLKNQKMKRNILILVFGLVILTSVCAFFTDTTLSRLLWGFPSRSNGLLYFICIFTLFAIAAAALPSANFSKRSLQSIQVPLLINLIYCSIQLAGRDPIAWNNPYNPLIGTFGNPNFSGAVLGITSALYLLMAITSSKIWKFVTLGLCFYSFGLSILTDSLQGPAIAIVGFTLVLIQSASRKISRNQLLTLVFCVLFTGLLSIISFLGFGPAGSSLYQYTLRLRLDYWWIALQTAISRPFTGIGPDSFLEGYFLHRSQEFVTKYGVGLRADSAHSAPLNFLANSGFIAFSLYVFLIIVTTFFAFGILFKSPKNRIDVQAIALMWLLFFIQSLISLEQVGLGVLQWISGGLVLHFYINKNVYLMEQQKLTNRKANKERPITTAKYGKFSAVSGEIAALSIVASAFLFSAPLRDEISLRKISSSNFQNQEAQSNVKEEIQSLSPFALQEFRRARHVTDYYLNIGDVDAAMRILSSLIDRDPESADAWSQIAKIENFRSNFADEIAARNILLKIDPLNYRNMLDLARAYVKNGENDAAASLAKNVVRLATSNVEGVEATQLLLKLQSERS